MGLGIQVRSCRAFFTGQTTHTGRFAVYLATDLKGQSKMLSAVRSALEIAEYAVDEHHPAQTHIRYANAAIVDVKIWLNVARLPSEINALARHCRRTQKAYKDIYTCHRAGQPIGRRKWVYAGTRTAGVIKKTLTVTGDGFFKPMQFVGKTTDLGSAGEAFADTWQVLSIVKSGAKIVNCSGKLYLGTHTPEKKVVDITLESWELTHTILRLTTGRIHPAAAITLSVSKSITGLVEAWIKTA